MASHFLAMLFRMKYIHRWGLMRNLRQENLSEHTLETAFIAHTLAVIAKKRLGKDIDPAKVALCAMYHDASEIITGDMPTPVKYFNSEIVEAYKKIERGAQQKLLEMLPADLLEEYTGVLTDCDGQIQKLVKAADKLSALIKCTEELSQGNREFEVAYRQVLKAIDAMELPEVEIFKQEFLDSFKLSLDEQKL